MGQRSLILASGSPRRRELLKQLGLCFEVIVKPVEEKPPENLAPCRQVEYLAAQKAAAVTSGLQEGLVIGADTMVVQDGKILGKPAGVAGARLMFAELSGKSHLVYTGLAIIDAACGRKEICHARTEVFFKPLTADEIQRYAATQEGLDKAGAYAIQGKAAMFVTQIKGSYSNVVGLPLYELTELLGKFGIKVL